MRKHTLLALALASALALGSTAAMAAPGAGGPDSSGHGWHGHHGGHDQGRMHMFDKLNLSEAQKASIKEIMSTDRTQDQASREALREQRRAFESMTPDQAGYQAAATSLAKAEGQAAQARVERMARLRTQVYAVLTPEQRAQAATLKAQAQTHRAERKQSRSESPQPAAE